METIMIDTMNGLSTRMAALAHESPIYEKLARYFIKDYMQVIFMTASEVAKTAKVSQGSVSRFCSALGYRGYNDLQRNLQHIVREEITAPQRYIMSFDKTGNKNKVAEIAASESENIKELELVLQSESYKLIAKTLANAKEVVLLSSRMSATLLPYMHYVMNKIRNNVSMVTPETLLWDTINLKDIKAAAIFAVCYPRYPVTLLEKLKELKAAGFTVYALTDSNFSPVSAIPDETIFVPITVSSIFDIYSTPILFLNLLCRDIAKNTDQIDKRLECIEQYDNKNGVYYKNTKGK